MKKYLLIQLSVLMVLASCRKDSEEESPPPDVSSAHGVFVVNEGNYLWGNASVSYINTENGEITGDVFFAANDRPLGDVAQSLCRFGDYIAIVVNNSNKTEIVRASDFTSVATINGLVSPRYFLPVRPGVAYISDLYSNRIAVVDLNNFQISSYIECRGSTEEMILTDSLVWVSNTRTSFVYVIDARTDVVLDSVAVGYASSSVCTDKQGRLWVMCAGGPEKASIHIIDPVSRTVQKSFQLSKPLDIWDKLRPSPDGSIMYYTNTDVYAMHYLSESLPADPLIASGSALFHGVAAEPQTGRLWVADAVDYVQNGFVRVYTPEGALIETYAVGAIPVDFLFVSQ